MTRSLRAVSGAGPAANDRGLVLLVTVIMIFILLIMAITFFAMASYETRQATYREESSEAFYLADAGVERTRGELLDDGKWRADLTGIPLGNGTYDLYVADSTYNGENAIYIYAEGHVDRADRAIEVWGDGKKGTPPLWAGKNIDGDQGNLCLDGWAHANVDADFGNNDSHLNNGSCAGLADYSDGSTIRPPIMYTEPGPTPDRGYPGATYYFVTYTPNPSPHFDVYDGAGNPIDVYHPANPGVPYDLGDQFTGGGGPRPTIQIENEELADFFVGADAVFPIDTAAGDSTIVLNFAEVPGGPGVFPNPFGYVDVALKGRAQDPAVNAMIINTHYTGGADIDERWKSLNWEGGQLNLNGHVRMEPRQGITALVHELDQSQAGTQLGTAAYPGMTYVTGNVDRIAGDLSMYGALMCLGDIVIRGGIEITYVDDFEEVFPPYLQYVVFGEAVALDVFVWREVPADTR